MNAFIGWLNRHIVPVAAKIGSIRWLVYCDHAGDDGRGGFHCLERFDSRYSDPI